MQKFIAILVILATFGIGYAVWSVGAGSPKQHFKIGVLLLSSAHKPVLQGFQSQLAERGYQEGVNTSYLFDGPVGSIQKLKGAAEKLVNQKPDLIFVSSTPAAIAIKKATENTSIPVVFGPVNDPVTAKLVNNMKMPGGSMTGVGLPQSEGRRFEYLLEIAPDTKHVFVPYNPKDKSSQLSIVAIRGVAAHFGIDIAYGEITSKDQVDLLITNIPNNIDAIFLPRDGTVGTVSKKIISHALSRQLPLAGPSLARVKAGALFSYGFDPLELGKQAAKIAIQIFRGVEPYDLPVEVAENHLYVNVQTAKTIGISIPRQILKQAKVIIR